MATHFEVTTAGQGAVSAIESAVVASQTITPSGSNQATTFSNLPASNNLFVTVSADENVFISIGAAPNASTDTAKRAMVAGGVRSFAFAAGLQVAVVTR